MLVDDATNLGIDFLHGRFRHVLVRGDRTPEEDLAFVLAINHRAQRVGHAVTRHHVARHLRRPLEVVRSTGGHLIHEQLFGDTPTEQHGDTAQQIDAVIGITIFFRQLHGQPQRPTTRDDSDLMHRIGFRHQLGHHRMARLVIRRIAFLFVVHHHAAALGAHQDLVLGFLEVFHIDQAFAGPRGKQGGLIDQIGQIGTGHAGRTARQNIGLDIRRHRHFAHVHDQNLLTTTDIRQRHDHLTVETAGTHQSRVEHVGTVGRGNHNDPGITFKTVHFNQHLVQGLLALVIATAQTSATLTTNGIQFVDEDDARRMLLGILEHVAHPRRTDADKHFDEIGTGNREERHFRFTGNRFGQQGLTRTRIADEQHAFRNPPTELLELGRITQEVDQFGDFFLGFVATSDVGKGNAVGRFIKQTRLALAEGERPALAAALHLAHEKHPDTDQQQHREPADEDIHQEGLLLFGLGFHLHVVFEQIGNHPQISRRERRNLLVIDRCGFQNATFDHHLGDVAASHFAHEFRILHRGLRCLTAVELVKQRHQDQTDHQPDGHILEHVIQCATSSK